MARTWRTVRVFISSTFRDMHAERDHLIKAVFPELRERLEAHRIHLVDIDLRWGVTAEQADNDRVLDLCLDEIKKSRPFFLGILGQRYGWVPKKLPESSVKKHGWLQGMAERSITELEILHGVLNDPKMRMHSLFYFRKDDFLASVPKELQDRVYLDGQGEKLQSVKEAIRRHCQNYGAPLREYPCAWDSNKPNPEDGTKGRITGLEEFGRLVKEDLLAALSREYPELTREAPAIARPGTEDWLAEEADFHERFIEARLQVYVGRDKVHRQLMDYLEGDSTGPLLLSGGSGTGKSSILGRLREEWSRDHPEDFVLPHFIGASPSSTDIRATLRRLCLAIKERFKLADEVPDRIEKLPEAFRKSLQAVPAGSRAVLIIDAVNQLDVYGGAHDMTWLPDALPPQVKIVVSCIVEPEKEQATLHALRTRNTQELKVEPLNDEERFEIVAQVPSISAKSLDPRQIALLLDNPATTNPLYLTVALEELRGFGSFEKLNERISSFPRQGDTVTAIFTQVIERLEQDFGVAIVRAVLSMLECSRRGLSESELSQITAKTDGAGRLLPTLRQLRPYLLRRGDLYDFYHDNLSLAVRLRYLAEEEVRRSAHADLALCFGRAPDHRLLDEFPWHLIRAKQYEEFRDIAADPRFLMAAWSFDPHSLLEYWSEVQGHSPIKVVETYRGIWGSPESSSEAMGPLMELFLSMGYHQACAAPLKSWIRHIRASKNETMLKNALRLQGAVAKSLGDIAEVQEVVAQQEALDRGPGSGGPSFAALANLAYLAEREGDFDRAVALHKEVEMAARSHGDLAAVRVSLSNQAGLLMRQGRLDDAARASQESVRLGRESGEPEFLAHALSVEGDIHRRRHGLQAALDSYGEAARLLRRLGKKLELAYVLYNTALILFAALGAEPALPLAQEALGIFREIQRPREMRAAEALLGDIRRALQGEP